jgi:hypothetical protein
LPSRQRIEPEEAWDGFTLFFSGPGVGPIREAFRQGGQYWLEAGHPPGAATPDGFASPSAEERARWRSLDAAGQAREPWLSFEPAGVVPPAGGLRTATDDWPFLYLRQPMVPELSWRGAAIMGGLSVLLLVLFLPRGAAAGRPLSFDGRMFFLGAGFMLIETKAVVHMALLFGSTWMVNSVVFFAVLLMILGANLHVLAVRPTRLWPQYAGLLLSLGLSAAVPLDAFLGLDRPLQVLASCALVFVPILFAGVIFATSFRRTEQPDLAFGWNIAGAMVGGLAEYGSMLLGFQHLVLVAIAFYVLSALLSRTFRLFPPALSAKGTESELLCR